MLWLASKAERDGAYKVVAWLKCKVCNELYTLYLCLVIIVKKPSSELTHILHDYSDMHVHTYFASDHSKSKVLGHRDQTNTKPYFDLW